VDRSGEDGAAVGIDFAHAFPSVVAVLLIDALFKRKISLYLAVIETNRNNTLSFFQPIDVLEHAVEFFDDTAVVWVIDVADAAVEVGAFVGSEGFVLAADVLVLAHYALYVLVFLLHYFTFSSCFLQLGSHLSIRFAQLLYLLFQFLALPFLRFFGRIVADDLHLFDSCLFSAHYYVFSHLHQIAVVLPVEVDELLP
jgi:hypothetical protein